MAIEDLLTSTEEQSSPFEEEMRLFPLAVPSLFCRERGRPFPCDFRSVDRKTPSLEIQKAFPKTGALTGYQILEGFSSSSDKIFPQKRVAVLFSGGPAPGGHNVLVGLGALLSAQGSKLLGVKGGPGGLLRGEIFPITQHHLEAVRNTGGFDFLGTDRTKIKTPDQIERVRTVCKQQGIEVLVIVGGDDSNTNAALLSEALLGDEIQVLGVPKTIDGDMQVPPYLPITFGFDTATRIYGELVGNLLKDMASSLKYWHFVKLMGRSASHVTLEVAIQTKVTMALISEEIAQKKISYAGVVKFLAEAVAQRAAQGLFHGVALIPEGVVEFIPDFKILLDELNSLGGQEPLMEKLSKPSRDLFDSLPPQAREGLMAERDSHGNVQLSSLETEELLAHGVSQYLAQHHPGVPFNVQRHFFGYEGRCGVPSPFDLNYCYQLGLGVGSLALRGKTGYMISASSFNRQEATFYALPLSGLLKGEKRGGRESLVIEKALVDLSSPAFRYYETRRAVWQEKDCYCCVGPRQYTVKGGVPLPLTLILNERYEETSWNLYG